jgi:hypothetical protein
MACSACINAPCSISVHEMGTVRLSSERTGCEFWTSLPAMAGACEHRWPCGLSLGSRRATHHGAQAHAWPTLCHERRRIVPSAPPASAPLSLHLGPYEQHLHDRNVQPALCDATVRDAWRPRKLGCPVPSQRRACWIIRSNMARFLRACLRLWRTVPAKRTGSASERRLHRSRAAVPLRSLLCAPGPAPYRALSRTGVACTPGHSRRRVRLLQAVEGFGPTGQDTVLGRG